MSENQKKVWITGASSGIGKATAEKFAKENWKVAISARREELLNEMAKDQNIFAYPMDVTDQNKTEETFNKIIKESKTNKIKIGYKFGLEFMNSKKGRKFISSLKNKIIFVDLKLNDTVNTMMSVVKALKDLKINYLTVL